MRNSFLKPTPIVDSAHFWGVQNFEFQFIYLFYFIWVGGMQENIYIFGGMNFLGSSQNWTIFRGHFYGF